MAKVFEKILVMSDIHLTSRDERIIGLDPSKQLKGALTHALDSHPDASLIVFTGDLTHSGTKDEYLCLKEIISNIQTPIKLMMGNHDNRKNFLEVFPAAQIDENGFLQSSTTFSNHRLLFLDSLNFSPGDKRKNEGLLCERRLAWLNNQLKLETSKRVILFMHHPAFPVGFKGMDKIKLMNSEDLFSILAVHKNIAHIVSGHIHRTISGNVRGHSFSIFKSTCHQMPMQLDSDNVKLSSAEPAAYGLLCLNHDDIIVHTEDYEFTADFQERFEKYN